jgi:hypothetical protein
MYEFEYFKFKFVRIESKISGLAVVESASFFFSPLIANGADAMGQVQQACQEEWKMCRKEK